jgi:hypothetical protein
VVTAGGQLEIQVDLANGGGARTLRGQAGEAASVLASQIAVVFFTAVNIRTFVLKAARLSDLVELGTPSPRAAAFLEASVRAGLNILVAAGGTQAGGFGDIASPPAPDASPAWRQASSRPSAPTASASST